MLSDPVPPISPDQIRPYASAIILQYVGDSDSGISELTKKLRQLKTRDRSGRKVEVIASGMRQSSVVSFEDKVDDQGSAEVRIEVDGFICRVTDRPSWAMADSPFSETSLDLVVALERQRLLAIHCDSGLSESIQRWLDKAPPPPFRRIPPGTLNAALLTGEAKGLWLRGTHARRTTKADSKNLSGRRLQDALNPLADSSFAMGSARAELPAGELLGTYSGSIGTTPRKSLVWISPTENYRSFLHIIRDLLVLLEGALTTGASVDSPYPWLATQQQGLSGVTRAYEMTSLSVDEIPRTPDWPDGALEAAALLERAIIDVTGESSGPGFVADVGLDGSYGGKIRCVMTDDNATVRLAFGLEGAPTDHRSVELIVNALQFTDLVTLYYESGHAISSGNVWSSVISPYPFPNWEWKDFTGFDICSEKPDGRSSQDIHDAIGTTDHSSLFSWVLTTYGESGWLTCDDGPGEVADFVKYDLNGTVTLIHIKAAKGSGLGRRVNVTAYEVVTSQATKNLPYLNIEQLVIRLANPTIARPACWYDGARVDDRSELIEYLEVRPADTPLRIVIVQPQITSSCYERTFRGEAAHTDKMRLGLLETLLNSARGTVTAIGADLYVVGSL